MAYDLQYGGTPLNGHPLIAETQTVQIVSNIYVAISLDIETPELQTSCYKGQHRMVHHGPSVRGLEERGY